MIEYCKKFLKEIKAIKSYLNEFKKDGFIKPKIDLKNCIIKDIKWQSIIFII